jgi:nucleotide-binding universal stress UspA family protein
MKVLLAIDGSNCSEAAVATLIKQYKAEDTEVLIMHVVDSGKLMPVTYGFGAGPALVQDYTAIEQQWRTEGEGLVSRTATRLHSAGFKTSTKIAEGDARTQILDYAGKWRPDVIVVGSHGWKGLDRLLLGSVSEAIARHAGCSVEIVRAQAVA